MAASDIATLDLTGLAWQRAGGEALDGPERLVAVLEVRAGDDVVPHHLEAWEVVVDDAGVQVPADRDLGADLDAIYGAVGGEGPWATVLIDRRRYVVMATPFCT